MKTATTASMTDFEYASITDRTAMKYLVIDKGAKAFLKKFRDQYKLFGSPDAAVKFARSIGFESQFEKLELPTQIGMAEIYQCGDQHVMVLALEESDKADLPDNARCPLCSGARFYKSCQGWDVCCVCSGECPECGGGGGRIRRGFLSLPCPTCSGAGVVDKHVRKK